MYVPIGLIFALLDQLDREAPAPERAHESLTVAELKRRNALGALVRLRRGDVFSLEGFRARDLVPEEGATPESVGWFRAIVTLAKAASAPRPYALEVAPTFALLEAAVAHLEEAFEHWRRAGGRSARDGFEKQQIALVERLDALALDLVACERAAAQPSTTAESKLRAHREKAEAALAERRWDDAAYEWERACALDPTDANRARLTELKDRADVENYRTWAERHAAAGKRTEAIECLERLLRRAPADAAARARLAELRT